jgi:L-threonylcarbamoyladenylate synthase
MKVLAVDLKKDFSEVIAEAIAVLQKGGVIVYPTDTVYSLGANACDWQAVNHVFKIKNRPHSKPMPIIARNIKWVRELAFVPPKLEIILEKIWPGATTVVLPKKNIIPKIITANGSTVGIRIPNFSLTDRLLAKFGYPITSTSANISGDQATGDVNKVLESFKEQVWKPDLILDAGVLPLAQSSTVLDFSTIKPRILRVGPSKPDQLLKLLDI